MLTGLNESLLPFFSTLVISGNFEQAKPIFLADHTIASQFYSAHFLSKEAFEASKTTRLLVERHAYAEREPTSGIHLMLELSGGLIGDALQSTSQRLSRWQTLAASAAIKSRIFSMCCALFQEVRSRHGCLRQPLSTDTLLELQFFAATPIFSVRSM